MVPTNTSCSSEPLPLLPSSITESPSISAISTLSTVTVIGCANGTVPVAVKPARAAAFTVQLPPPLSMTEPAVEASVTDAGTLENV